MKCISRFRVNRGDKVRLKDIDPGFQGPPTRESQEGSRGDRNDREKLRALQALLYADGQSSLLICLQGLDAGGKDGTISHILGAMNPQGCRVTGFKQPSTEELAHDFLWRIHKATPPRGQVAIFNRSHYEDVLVVRVHKLVPHAVWSRRYDQINEFEKELVASNTHILKFFLHISKKEQLKRFEERLDDPMKQWKISEADYKERQLLGRLHHGLRGGPVPLQHPPCAVVHHPLRSQVVPQPGDCADRRGAHGGHGHEAPQALGRPGAHSPRVSRRQGEVGEEPSPQLPASRGRGCVLGGLHIGDGSHHGRERRRARRVLGRPARVGGRADPACSVSPLVCEPTERHRRRPAGGR